MKPTTWLVAFSLIFCPFAYCESGDEIATPKKVGNLTQIAEAKFIDLDKVTTIEGYLMVIVQSQHRTFPLTEDGVTNATEFLSAGLKKPVATSGHPNDKRVVAAAGVKFDEHGHSLFSTEKTIETFDAAAAIRSFERSLSFFTELLKQAQ